MSERLTPDERLGANPRILTLGEGKVAISYGFYKQLPCIFLAEAKKPGEIGSSAKQELNGHGGLDDAVVLRFSSLDAILAHLELVRDMVEHAEKRVKEAALSREEGR